MNRHDKARKDILVRALKKAREKADTALLYLLHNDRSQDDIAAAGLALEHINIALEHLGVVEEGSHDQNQ